MRKKPFSFGMHFAIIYCRKGRLENEMKELEKNNCTHMSEHERELNRRFARYLWGGEGQEELGPCTPRLEIKEKEASIEVRYCVKGVSPRDLRVEFDEKAVYITFRKKRKKEFTHQERSLKEEINRSVTETINLPGPIEADEVSAEIRNNELVLILPRQKDNIWKD